MGIGLASRLALRLASNCFSSTPIVGLPEIKASESATDTTIECLSLFQAIGIDFFYSIYQYCSSYSHQKRDPWIEISRLQVHKKDFLGQEEKVMNVWKNACKVTASLIGLPADCTLEKVKLFDR